MTRTVTLQLAVDGDDDHPVLLASRHVPEGERLTAYTLASWMLETAARLITWQAYRDRFDAITETMGEAS